LRCRSRTLPQDRTAQELEGRTDRTGANRRPVAPQQQAPRLRPGGGGGRDPDEPDGLRLGPAIGTGDAGDRDRPVRARARTRPLPPPARNPLPPPALPPPPRRAQPP